VDEKVRCVTSAKQTGYLGVVPPPLPPPGRTVWTFVERPDDAARVAAAFSGCDTLAIDAEFMQARGRAGPRDPAHTLALLQIMGAPGPVRAVVLDALRLRDLSALVAPFEDERILKLFHGIGADAQMLATRGLVVRRTLDLEAVSRTIFGSRESSLQAMLLRACGVRLDKSLQRSDWLRRPLAPAMLAYAARDAHMTLVLYTWLAQHYRWAVALHEALDLQPPPAVAGWIAPFLQGGRPQRGDWAPVEAALAEQRTERIGDLRGALAMVRAPAQVARLLRLIGDLAVTQLAAEIVPFLAAPAAEVRASAARCIGRLRDPATSPALRDLLEDPVQDVREAAQFALDTLTSAPAPPRVRRDASGGWTSGGDGDGDAPVAGWQAALLARLESPGEPDTAARAADDDEREP
jgi:hypothetical protein